MKSEFVNIAIASYKNSGSVRTEINYEINTRTISDKEIRDLLMVEIFPKIRKIGSYCSVDVSLDCIIEKAYLIARAIKEVASEWIITWFDGNEIIDQQAKFED